MSISKKIIDSLSDKILVKKAQRADKDAYGKLYMKYLDQIYRYIYFRVNMNRSESEDLAEIVFIRAWNKIRQGSFKNDNFRAFIYRIARNIVIDSYRKNNKTARLEKDVPSSETPEDTFLQKSGQKELLLAIQKLSDEQKQVVTLKFIDGANNEEIAQIMNKSNQAVRALQHRGLKQLKILLETKN